MKNTLWGLLKIFTVFVVLGVAAQPYPAFAQADPGSIWGWNGFVFIIVLIVFWFIYFVPYFLARNRNTINKGIIFWVNLFFGWTILGWCFALLLASTSQTMASREIEKETLRRLKQ